MNRKIKNLPMYPLLPFAPMLIAGGMLFLEAVILRRLRRLARSLESLQPSATPA